ncbi:MULTISPECIES: glutamine--fructose-6-phosphate transaminase (isomerizing) [Enterococcus]|uniref:Glutamine--fructose-6-phosphate aminotransferase [isomerizing] n=1 Tax=Enterococcus thailandicus TaxID=417368 RepID=A0A510WC06_ENTTH|nr:MULTISPECIES: glutamine--fructose-6-phosphate transaminase (isomerizing) [Enterococcus]MDK4351311.1 glutamine--fructose-6-phosphate transaminase (isomerizing) [Enterococcus thailandicus]MDT2732956.1 glutamine--fructose-6-phosphate transaminase (isomerizing) [Enterococcus thailandicus]MDT2752064.1 glutamine--fructose-6-phosphate transaminase (isomerizing) [Enterococcus thailandicus]MDT2777058.1 glutamine--fructose-6-phosphate transaminase (isomerizing) [Enterococcus thailandicus]MDT2794033.1
MCGIVGMIGLENVTPGLVNGLEKLEYRGYDSAGIFVANDSADYLIKSQGRIQNLKDRLTPEVVGTIGIGHTRWATHGIPSEKNAHPHTSQSGRFVLVHNGVIENFEELKESYLADHTLIGETDTEIIAHLIEVFANNGLSTKEAFLKTLQLTKGSYAFGLVDRTTPDVIYVAKNKSPLLIGLGNGFNVIASDAMAMLAQTKTFVEIEDQEMVLITADDVTIQNFQGDVITRESFEAQVDASDIEKGTYPYYMLKEIDEQPIIMRKIAQTYVTAENQIALDQELVTTLADSDRIYIVACGTSYHAGLAGKQALETLTGIPVEVHLASEFGYHMPLLSKKPFFIFLSQSGETADSRQVLVKINQLGLPSLTITNVAGSTLSREASFTVLLHAGPEIAVASTKAYTAQIAVLTLLAKAVGDQNKNMLSLDFDVAHELSLAATAMETIITQKEYLEQLATAYLNDTRNAFYIGRGSDYYVSLEAALKLKEISYIQAEGFAAGELKHGTIALIEEGTPVIGIISDPITGAHTRGNLKEVESRGANTLVISTKALAKENDQLVLPTVHPFFTPLTTVVPTQLLAYYATLLRGFDVDKPRNLAKSVTVE